jgi:predicted N-acyltransferase
MSVQVLDGVAPQWAEHVGDDVPIHAGAPWINATSHRLTRARMTVLATEDGRNAGLHAAVVEDPQADEMIGLYRMFLAEPKVFKFPAASVAARCGLRAQVPPAESWVPNLTVLYPGFDSFVAASGGPTPAVTEALVDGVLSWAVDNGMKAVSFPYVRADSGLPEVLAERGFLALPLTYRSRLPLNGGFGDYLASLSRKRRSRVTSEMRRLAQAGVETKRCSFEDVWPAMLALRCHLVERYGQKPSEELETTNLRQLLTCFGEDRIRLYCSFLDDRVVGFTLYVVWRDSWYAAYTGTCTDARTRFVYFDHLFYAPIAGAATEGARVVDFGIGAWEAKHHRGCELTPVDVWVRALDPEIERGVKVAGTAMQREDGSVPGTT